MRKTRVIIGILLITVSFVMGACAPTPVPPASEPQLKLPTIELIVIEVARPFPWSDLPEASPLALDYVFSIKNSNDFNVTLDRLNFTIGFEGSPIGLPDEYFPVAKVLTFEKMGIPPKTANRLRVSYVHDSADTWRLLKLSMTERLIKEGKPPTDIDILVKEWWLHGPSPALKASVIDGEAQFSSNYGVMLVQFKLRCYPCLRRESISYIEGGS